MNGNEPNTERNSMTKRCMSHVRKSASKSAVTNGRRLQSSNHLRKKLTCAFCMLYVQQSLSTRRWSSLLGIRFTDVLVLCPGFSKSIPRPMYSHVPEMWNAKQNIWFFDITKLGQSLGSGTSDSLVDMHCLHRRPRDNRHPQASEICQELPGGL